LVDMVTLSMVAAHSEGVNDLGEGNSANMCFEGTWWPGAKTAGMK
jgi:hypothetical protein